MVLLYKSNSKILVADLKEQNSSRLTQLPDFDAVMNLYILLKHLNSHAERPFNNGKQESKPLSINDLFLNTLSTKALVIKK